MSDGLPKPLQWFEEAIRSFTSTKVAAPQRKKTQANPTKVEEQKYYTHSVLKVPKVKVFSGEICPCVLYYNILYSMNRSFLLIYQYVGNVLLVLVG